jgi:hypothetical protein
MTYNMWSALLRALAVALATLSLAGCATGLQEKRKYLGGVDVEINQTDVGGYAESQTAVMNHFVVLSGQATGDDSKVEWRRVVDAGIDYVDARCERYIDSIFWFNRAKNGVKSQIDIVGTATAGILGATEAAAKSISLTAIAFGLGSQSVENYGKGLLYEIDPASLREVVEKSQGAYIDGLQGVTYTSRPAAMRAIRGYLVFCLPATLESQVNKAVANSEFQTVTTREGAGKTDVVPKVDQVRPEAVVYPATAVAQAQEVREAIMTKSKRDPVKVKKMKDQCWPAAGVPAGTLEWDFFFDPRFAGARDKVAVCMAT